MSDRSPMEFVAEPSDRINSFLVAVGSRFARALNWDDETWDWDQPPFSAENSRGLKPFKNVSIREMFDREWSKDDTAINHLLQYLVFDANGTALPTQPRISATGIDLLRSKGFNIVRTMLYADFDLPDHKPWTETAPEVAMEIIDLLTEASKPECPLHGCLIVFTRRGFHVVMFLSTPLEIFESDAYEREWHKQIARFGLIPDSQSKGWHHPFRFPAAPYDAEYKDKNGYFRGARKAEEQLKADKKFEESQRAFRYFRGWEDVIFRDPQTVFPSNPTEHAEIKKKRSSSRQKVRYGNHYAADAVISNRFDFYAKPIGIVIRDGKQEQLHQGYLSLSGYLCTLGMPPEIIPGFIGMVANHANSSNPAGNVDGAKGTVKKWLNRDTIRAGEDLKVNYFHIWKETTRVFALMKAHQSYFGENDEVRHVELLKHSEGKDEVTKTIHGDGHSLGTSLACVSTGTGKTFATAEFAASDTKTNIGFAADTNVLAKQVSNMLLRNNGRTSLRVFGSSSVTGDDACKYRDSALNIANSGQSVFALLCMGGGKRQCEHFDNCKAKDRREGDSSSNIMIGPHAKLPELLDHVGETGTLIIDEAKAQILKPTVTLADLLHAREFSEHFSKSYIKRMTPLLDSFIAWVSTISTNTFEGVPFNDIPTACEDAIDGDQLRDACSDATIEIGESVSVAVRQLALSAIEEGKPPNPPIRVRNIHRIRTQPSFASDVARASRVFSILYDAMARTDRTAVYVGKNEHGRFAKLLYIDPIYQRAVNRPKGRTILLDATGETQMHVLKKLCPDINIVRVDLEDAFPVQREMHHTKNSRKLWFEHGNVRWDGSIKFAFEHIRDTIAERQSKHVCIITHKIIRVVLQAALGISAPEISDPRAAWRAMGHTDEELDEGTAFVRQYLPATQYTLYHYGAERGRNEATSCDTIITLGDPRPNLDEVRYEADFIGANVQDRMYAATAATLTQAHGRARHLSPYRTGGQLFAMHIGSVLPSEPQWHMGDRVMQTYAVSPEYAYYLPGGEFNAMLRASGKTPEQVASELGVSTRTVKWWVESNCAIRVHGGGRCATTEAAIRACLVPAPDIPATAVG